MEQGSMTGTPVSQGEAVELRGGRIWELVTATDERVVVDRSFRPRGGVIRNRWRCSADDPWPRLFGVRPVNIEAPDSHAAELRLRVVIGTRAEVSTGFRDVWRTQAPLVAVRELEDPEA